jgi:hypothetical protein
MNPPDCAATPPADGLACGSSTSCNYDGASCSCGHFCPSYPVGERPCDPDAGITTNCCDTSGPPTWHCFSGPKTCASPRPHVGDPCSKQGDSCAIGPPEECAQLVLECDMGIWKVPNNECPVSTARAKQDIAYVGPEDAARLADDLMRVRLATYRYKGADASSHLGFIIEDMPQGSPAVMASRERVDLYGYVSMTVATLQEQQKRIDRLERELARCKR